MVLFGVPEMSFKSWELYVILEKVNLPPYLCTVLEVYITSKLLDLYSILEQVGCIYYFHLLASFDRGTVV